MATTQWFDESDRRDDLYMTDMSRLRIPDRKCTKFICPLQTTSRAKIISRILMGAIAVAVFVADQVTKAMVESRISERAVVPVVRGFFNLINTKNSGAVFGMFSDRRSGGRRPC